MSIPVILQPGVLATDCYPASPQELNESIVNGIVAEMDAAFSGFVRADTAPGPEYDDYLWFNTTDHQWYSHFNGDWLRPHPAPANGQERRLWVGTAAGVWSYDGGDGSDPAVVPPTGATGAMWQVDTTFDAKFLVGPGTFAGGDTVAVGGTGGEDEHVLTQAELPSVDLQLDVLGGQADNLDADNSQILCNPNAVANPGSNAVQLQVPLGGSATPITNLPPYRGVYVIRRTGRQNIKA